MTRFTESVAPPDDAYCLACGYALRGLPEPRCPECGKGFDPIDAQTFVRGRPMGPIVRFLSRPLGWPFGAVGVILLLLSLLACAVPGGYFALFSVSVLGWLAAWALLGARVVVFCIVRAYYAHGFGRDVNRWWIVIPVAFVLAVLFAVSDVGPVVLFKLHKPALDRFAAEVAALPPGATIPNRRIGIYQTSTIERIDGTIRFFVAGAGFIDRYGFAYSPDGLPAGSGLDHYDALDGGWYVWVQRF